VLSYGVTPAPLKFVGGHPALDFINTVDWTARGPVAERLPDYDRWLEWSERSGSVRPADAGRLRGRARQHPAGAARALQRVHAARHTLQRTLAARAAGHAPARNDIKTLNRLLGEALARLELAPTGHGAALVWRDIGGQLDGPLWPLVWAAARLLESADADRIRVCDGVDCGWMYLDRSRNGLRRWCEMSTCGTREKNRRRATAT
jgi:predicted RNA-binding Zn ribbon-like protein